MAPVILRFERQGFEGILADANGIIPHQDV